MSNSKKKKEVTPIGENKWAKYIPSNPMPTIGNFFVTKPHIWLSFAIPFSIMFAAYMFFGVYPSSYTDPDTGAVTVRSVLSLDLNAQYVYYFAYMRDALFGPESILYSWSRNLSGEFIGIIGYYLFSPFNLIVWAFPLSHITEGLMLMIVTKIGFIGVTMAIYLSVSRGFSKHTTVMFSIMYALLSYNIVQTMNPMWLDGVMALPLVIMGIESLIKHSKYKLLVFSLVYSFVTCFYIGYMIGIFAALYFIYYILTSRKYDERDGFDLFLLFSAVAWFVYYAIFILGVFVNNNAETAVVVADEIIEGGSSRMPHIITGLVAVGGAVYCFFRYRLGGENLRVFFKRSGLFAISAVLAIMMAAFILLPVHSALSLGKLEFSNPDYTVRSNFSNPEEYRGIFEISRKLFVNSYDTVRMPEGLPFLFSGTLALILLPVYFFCKRIRRARRFGGILLLTSLIISMMIVPIDMFWHGLQNPNWLPYRYAFMFSFLVIAFGAEAFENIRKIPHKVIGMSAVVFGALLIFWEGANTHVAALGNDGRDVFDWFGSALIGLFMVIIFAGILIVGRDKMNKQNLITYSLIALVAVEMMFNTQNSIDKQHTDIHYSSRDSFSSMVLTRQVMDGIIAEDDGFWRSEKKYIRSACDTMALRMRGVTHSSSMLNDRAIAMLKNLGYQARSHSSRYSGNTPLTDDLFGFKYILSTEKSGHSNIESVDDIDVYVNENYLPIAYLVSGKIMEYAFEGDFVFNNQNKLLSYMLRSSVEEYGANELVMRNVQVLDGDYSVYMKIHTEDEGHIEYDLIADYDGHFYAYLPTTFATVYYVNVNGSEAVPVNDDVHYLGYFNEGTEFKVRIGLIDDDVFFREITFVGADNDLLEQDFDDDMLMHEPVLPLIYAGAEDTELSQIWAVDEWLMNVHALGEGYTVYMRTANGEASVTYELFADLDGDYFAYLPSDHDRNFAITVNGSEITPILESRNRGVYHLGYFEDGQNVTVTLTLDDDMLLFTDERFARANPDLLQRRGEAADRYYARMLLHMKTFVDNDSDRANHEPQYLTDEYITPIDPGEETLTNLNVELLDNGHHRYFKQNSGNDASIAFSFTAEESGDYFSYFPSGYIRSYDIFVNDEQLSQQLTDEHAHFLGTFSKGERINVQMRLSGDEIFFNEGLFIRAIVGFEQEAMLRNQTRVVNYFSETAVNDYFVRVEYYEKLPQNVKHSQLGEGYHEWAREAGSSGDAHIEYFLQADESGEFYMYFPSTYERKCNLWVNDNYRAQVYETDHHHIHHLGFFEKGEKFKVTLSLTGDKVFFREEFFMRLDEDLLEADVARVHEANNSEFTALSNTHLRITGTAQRDTVLFTTIPNEPGWRVTVNGQRVEIEEIADGLIAIPVEAGDVVIDLKFFPHRMDIGILLTFAGIGGIVGLHFLMSKVLMNERAKSRRTSKRSRLRAAVERDEYDGFDSDYINVEPDEEEFDFDEHEQKAQVDDDDIDDGFND
jgi:uncharacterized membrane protein YfhO